MPRTIFRLVSRALVFVSLMSVCAVASAQDAAKGFEVDTEAAVPVRLENETMFAVPMDRVEPLWNFLRERFQGTQSLVGYNLRTVESVEQFADTYFDTPDRKLLHQWAGLRRRQRIGEGGEKKELIQLKVTPRYLEDKNDQNRYEVKFARRHDSGREADDVNEILSLVRHSQKDALRENLAKLGVKVEKLERFMSLRQERRRIYFRVGDRQLFTITLDITNARALWATGEFGQLEFEISENAFSNADPAERERLLTLQKTLMELVESQTGKLVQDQAPKVVKMYEQFENRNFLGRLAIDFQIWVYLAIGFALFITLSAAWNRRQVLALAPSRGAA